MLQCPGGSWSTSTRVESLQKETRHSPSGNSLHFDYFSSSSTHAAISFNDLHRHNPHDNWQQLHDREPRSDHICGDYSHDRHHCRIPGDQHLDDHGNISITIQFAQRPPTSSRWALLIILTIIILIRTPARTLRANWVLSCMTRWTRTPTSPGKAWCGDEGEDQPKPKPYALWMMISLVYENDGARVGCKAIEMLLVTMT